MPKPPAGVFMGWKAGEVRMADPDVHEMWSHKHFEYEIFLDTDPPMVRACVPACVREGRP